MLKWLMRRVAAFERQWNYDASYVHEMIEADPRAAWMFQRATSLGKYRKDVPVDALAAAAITAVRREDCGPCTQLGVSMAERAGVDPKVLRAVLTETPVMMPPDVALAWRFTRADARLVTDGGGKVPAALNVIEGADRVGAFLAGVVRKGWIDEISVRFATINGLPGLIVSGPRGLVQTTAFELEGDVIKAIYVVRNPDKLQHLAPA